MLTLVVVAAGGVLVLPRLVDLNRHRELIQRKAGEALGRDVRLGEMKLSLWPVFGIRVDDVVVAALAAEGGGELLSAESVRLGARPLPLLRKQLDVTSIVVQRPRATLVRSADGSWNLSRAPSSEPVAPPAEAPAPGSTVRVGRLRLTDGELTIRDHGAPGESPSEIVLSKIDLELNDFAPDRPFSFKLGCAVDRLSDARVSLEGRAGPLGPDRFEAKGTIAVAGAETRFAGSDGELRTASIDLSARYGLRGETVEIADLQGVIGSSDLAGSITADLSTPALRFDIQSRAADLGELFSFLTNEEQTASESGGETAASLKLDGTLRIDRGVFQTIDFSKLEATMKWRDGIATLDPLRVSLYEGNFAGRIVGDLQETTPVWEVEGEAVQVDVDAFLADNADAGGLISGRFTGRVATEATGADYEAIVRGLSGSGAADVREGRIGRLDLLKTLSRVSGVFGENTLRSLSEQLASEGTEFDVLSTDVRLDGGKMRFDNLLLQSPVFRLAGQGALDLLSTELQGRFRLVLSPEISAAMRGESSRAAQLFWNSRTQQVEMPFSLSGPFDKPTPGIDFKSVAGAAIKDRTEDRLRDLVADKLGLGREKKPAAPPAEPSAAATGLPPAVSVEGEPPGGSAPGLAAEITRTRWGGSVLVRDLKIEGLARGEKILRAELVVMDSRGIEIRRTERLKDVETFLAAAADRTAQAEIPWRFEVEGKRLVLAKFPVRVTLVVIDADGNVAETSVEVDR